MENKYYVRDWAFMGIEPRIFTKLEEAEVNDEFAQFLPSIMEFNTELEARRFIKKYNKK